MSKHISIMSSKPGKKPWEILPDVFLELCWKAWKMQDFVKFKYLKVNMKILNYLQILKLKIQFYERAAWGYNILWVDGRIWLIIRHKSGTWAMWLWWLFYVSTWLDHRCPNISLFLTHGKSNAGVPRPGLSSKQRLGDPGSFNLMGLPSSAYDL